MADDIITPSRVRRTLDEPRVNYSLRREVAFVVVGSVIGAFLMHSARIYADTVGGSEYMRTLLVMAHIVGSDIPILGLALHIAVATSIGIVCGIILYKAFGVHLSSVGRGILYGFGIGLAVLVVFALPVSSFIIAPAIVQVTGSAPADTNAVITDAISSHVIWGLCLGIIASALTRRFGANYRCHRCDVEFNKRSTYRAHVAHLHSGTSRSVKRILILGGGYAGTGVLRILQRELEDSVNIAINVISEDNFFLSTPLLAEMATGHVEPRHISTPIRTFCKRARYYHAQVESIDLESRTVTTRRRIDGKTTQMSYDYLVTALGGQTNYYGNTSVEKHALTIKTLEDALVLRNRVISLLEGADQEDDIDIQSRMTTFIVVGGGFSGVETAGALHEFVHESVERYYRNIEPSAVRVILVSAIDGILPEIGTLGAYAQRAMTKRGIEIMTKTKLASMTADSATLDNGTVIPCMTLVWAGGVKASSVIAALDVEHGTADRVRVNEFLQIPGHPQVYALGDCAHITDTDTQKPYPPTAQNAIRQAKVAARNIISDIRGRYPVSFDYDSVGSMATLGGRDGVAIISGIKITGILAWLLWRNYYLSRLPSLEKRVRVSIDWLVDLFVPSDVTRLGNIREKN